VTNLSITLGIRDGTVPWELFVRKGQEPTRTDNDKMAIINPPGGGMGLSIYDSPPLTPGLWVVGAFNPGPGVDYQLVITLGSDTNATPFTTYPSFRPSVLLDDMITNSTVFVPVDMLVADVMVDVRIDHPRAADLSLHLVSPSGTRVLLSENRGGLSATNYGSGYLITNSFPQTASHVSPDPITNLFALSTNISSTDTQFMGTLKIDYDFYDYDPDEMQVYYDGKLIFDSGYLVGTGVFFIEYGPGTDTNIMVVMDQNGGNETTIWAYTATLLIGKYKYITFTENTNLTQTPIKFTPAQFTAGTNSLDTNHLYVLPEESLGKFIGEEAFGPWHLEVWDNLAGNAFTNSELITWRLNIAFINTNAPVTILTNGVASTNTLLGGQAMFFAVDMPPNANFATNILGLISGDGNLQLIFNQAAVPDTNVAGNVTLLTGPGTAVLNGPAGDVMPGLRYYLGVRNNSTGTNTFTLQVDFDTATLPPGTNAVTTITNAPGTMVYFFTTIPNNATNALFEIFNANGDVDLYLAHSPFIPTTNIFEYASTNLGTGNELIMVTNSPSGDWTIGVYNGTTNDVTYQIQVMYSALTSPTLLTFVGAPKLAAGSVTLTFSGVAGRAYDLQASSDLKTWTTVTTITADGTAMPVSDPAPDPKARFYRLRPATP
jgi:subtilisin-like proprotein convertase family protein